MSKSARGGAVLLLIAMLLSAMPAVGQEASELLASPKYESDAREPSFVEYTAERLEQEVVVVSGRSSAVFSFNTPGVRIHLPRCDNSVYAQVELSEPVLRDAQGNEVAYEPERGLYDHELFLDQYRFAKAEGSEDPPEYAMAEGTITVRYPLRVKTLTMSPGQPLPAGVVVSFDGPFLKWQQGGVELPEAASFTGITPMRIYDAEGRRLKRHPSQEYRSVNGVTTERLAYWGEIAELQVDTVEQWAVLDISYRLPQAPLLSQSKVGAPIKLKDKVEPTPGGTVTMTVRSEVPAGEAAGEDAQPITAAISPDAARERLAELGYSEVNESMLVMSAVKGETEAVRMFLAAGLPVDARYDDRTPLLSAAMYGRVETALLLIEAGADVNARDTNDSTPLLWAAQKCEAHELVRALVEAGADVNAKAKGGGNPLMMATVMSCTENTDILTKAGAK